MQVNLQIPDDIARRIIDAGGDLSRRALEALPLDELRPGEGARHTTWHRVPAATYWRSSGATAKPVPNSNGPRR